MNNYIMERRITKKVENHAIQFKNAIKDYLTNNKVNMVSDDTENLTSDFLRFVFDYSGVELEKEDFVRLAKDSITLDLSVLLSKVKAEIVSYESKDNKEKNLKLISK